MTTVETLTKQSINIPISEWQPQLAQIITQHSVAVSREWYELDPIFASAGNEVVEMQTELLPGEEIYLLKSLVISDIHIGLIMTYTGTIGWLRMDYVRGIPAPTQQRRPEFSPTPTMLCKTTVAKFAHYLNSFAKTPYIWGGNTIHGIDCSGFTSFLMRELFDLYLPRNSEQQRRAVAKNSISINKHELAMLPEFRKNMLYLIFLVNEEGRAYHVGVFVNGRVWDMDEAYAPLGRADGLASWSWEDFCERCLHSKRFHSLTLGYPTLGINLPEA
jgi:hypothetical protein